jgi:hypothetical protein
MLSACGLVCVWLYMHCGCLHCAFSIASLRSNAEVAEALKEQGGRIGTGSAVAQQAIVIWGHEAHGVFLSLQLCELCAHGLVCTGQTVCVCNARWLGLHCVIGQCASLPNVGDQQVFRQGCLFAMALSLHPTPCVLDLRQPRSVGKSDPFFLHPPFPTTTTTPASSTPACVLRSSVHLIRFGSGRLFSLHDGARRATACHSRCVAWLPCAQILSFRSA